MSGITVTNPATMGLLHTFDCYYYKQLRYGMAAVLHEYTALLEMPLNLHAWFGLQAGKFATVQMSLDCQHGNSSPYSQPKVFSNTHYGSYFTCSELYFSYCRHG